MRFRFTYILLVVPLMGHPQLFIPEDARVHIADGANLEVDMDFENFGVVENVGTFTLYGDWLVDNNFNSVNGEISFQGDESQAVEPNELIIETLTINTGGILQFNGNRYLVMENIDFQDGVLETTENTEFILSDGAAVRGGSVNSYFQGSLTAQGNGTLFFPVGFGGVYSPITFFDASSPDTEITVDFVAPNSVSPFPSDSVVGVSGGGLWEVQSASDIEDLLVQIDFMEEDLENFENENNIRRLFDTPVIAAANEPAGPFTSLGVSELFNSDSISFGEITSERRLSLLASQSRYLAIALAPSINPEGVVYVPEAFSPSASDESNRAFRIFGEKIVEEEFSLRIFNRFGIIVYQTTSFAEANRVGWDGINQNTGLEEPTGSYFYSLQLLRENQPAVEQKQGAFYLLR